MNRATGRRRRSHRRWVLGTSVLVAGALAACAARTDLIAYDGPAESDSGEASAESSTSDTGGGPDRSTPVEAAGDGVEEPFGPEAAAADSSDGSDAGDAEDSSDAGDAGDVGNSPDAWDGSDGGGVDAGCSFVDGGTGPVPAPDGGLLSLPSPEIYVGSLVNSVAIGDVSGDGRNDLVLSTSAYPTNNPSADWSIFVFVQNPCGGLSPPTRYPGTPGAHIHTVSIADVTGDGLPDVVFDQPQAIAVLPQDAVGGLGPMVVYGLPIDPRLTAVGDLNGDGLSDVFAGMSSFSPPDNGYVMLQSSGVLRAPAAVPSQVVSVKALQIADVTGDGLADVVQMGNDSFAVFPQQPNGTLGSETDYGENAGVEELFDMSLADVNGDGLTDLVATAGTAFSSELDVYAQTPSGLFFAPVVYAGGASDLAIADFDGDGRNDVVTVDVNLELRLQTSTGTLGAPLQYPAPLVAGTLTPGDLNSDGLVDLALVTYAGVSIVYGLR